MSVLGFSILVASFSFLCYKHPPSSWLITQWLRRPFLNFTVKPPLDHAPTIELSESSMKDVAVQEQKHSATKLGPKRPAVTQEKPSKEEVDRKAMPPPPPNFLRRPKQPKEPSSKTTTQPDSPPTPRTSVPLSFTLADEDTEPSTPSFPALNSAQRASGDLRGPPRLNAVPNIQPAVSGAGGLISPPMRSPLPNRGALSVSSLAPPPTHNSIPTKPRRKVLLAPGHSPLDWARLSGSPNSNLTGLPPYTPYLRVPPSVLKQMTGRKGKDVWTILGGKVYNITPYIPYHPGGEPELMKAAGRDGTRLFGEVHPWVNWEGMLEGCLVGVAVEEGEVKPENQLETMD